MVAAMGVASCTEVATKIPVGNAVTTGTYEASAITTYTWQVEYTKFTDRPRDTRRETFSSTSLVTRNGIEPMGAVTGPDDQGLYWPELPPRPTADELLASATGRNERRTDPQLLKSVEYEITFDYNGQRQTLPTNANVYREASQAFAQVQALALTYGPGNQTIAAAQRIANFER